uniref:Uncharacterized protein n=1 Tax=Meloidogyne incognita TaxID=6306 RepID=A0A914MMG7_MELIC
MSIKSYSTNSLIPILIAETILFKTKVQLMTKIFWDISMHFDQLNIQACQNQ